MLYELKPKSQYPRGLLLRALPAHITNKVTASKMRIKPI